MQHEIKLALPLLWLSLLLASTQAIGALPGESIVLNPSTGDYTITYWDYPSSPKKARIRQAIFVPATKIDPMVKSTFKLREEGTIVYTYRVTNGLKSRQALVGMRFDPVTDIVSALPLPKRPQDVDINMIEQIYMAGTTALTTPDGWTGGSYTSHSGGLRISWSYSNLHNITDGLPPGKTQDGFGFFSKDIPGIGMAQLDGHAPVPMFPAEGPAGELAKEFAQIEQNDYVPRNAAVPTISVPTPFNAAVLLDSIQTQMHTWIGMQLLDATFSSQLDRYFQSAISAYRLNQPKVGNQQVQTMRDLIKKEQPNAGNGEGDSWDSNHGGNHQNSGTRALIDPLAARVLDFDLNYVMKRMDGADRGQASPGATSPTLSVALSPATLWPPNGKLVPITAAVTVKDNNGSAQKIRLESITSNELLEAEDIRDASFGTDDRSFYLAAKRAGTNMAGRIYTVTYSATDASGNKATASATVTVPHDQGR